MSTPTKGTWGVGRDMAHIVPAAAVNRCHFARGLLVSRHLLAFEPVASMSTAEVAALIGPTIQRYLVGEIAPELEQDQI